MEDGGGMVNRYAAEHIIINGKDNIEPWINRYFVPEEEYHQLEAENAQLKAALAASRDTWGRWCAKLQDENNTLKAVLALTKQRQARLREALIQTRRELWHCNDQLKYKGATEGVYVTEALAASAKALEEAGS